jgi:hypothetical protein
MSNDFVEIEQALRGRAIPAYRPRPRQLVVSRQRGPVRPDAGNSFWVCKRGGDWCVCTWARRYYRVPACSSAVDVAGAFVDCGKTAQPRVPVEMVTRFGLVETDHADFDRAWPAE